MTTVVAGRSDHVVAAAAENVGTMSVDVSEGASMCRRVCHNDHCLSAGVPAQEPDVQPTI